MNLITLEHRCEDGSSYQASFLPGHGMSLVSFKRGEIEVIDQRTRKSFEERSAGLGSLIGPHFHRRLPSLTPPIDASKYPSIETGDPFSQGIARYAPWEIQFSSSNKVKAELSGEKLWEGVALSKLEGQKFCMQMQASLNGQGLSVELSVVSDTDSLVGLQYYYNLPPAAIQSVLK